MMRLDNWLWAARFFKTRSTAVEAIDAGHISVNGERSKPAKMLKAGDRVVVRKPPFEHAITVKGFAVMRGSAAVAATLYEESEESRTRRATLAAEMKSVPAPRFKGRPTKKTRRDYERWLRSSDDD